MHTSILDWRQLSTLKHDKTQIAFYQEEFRKAKKKKEKEIPHVWKPVVRVNAVSNASPPYQINPNSCGKTVMCA